MINSRDPAELLPRTRVKWEKLSSECKSVGIDLILTSTYRDKESQDALYAQGRSKPGPRVTNVPGNYSFHQHRVAFDVVPIITGKAIWDDQVLWARIGAIGSLCGLEWGGYWERWKDKPHFQDTAAFSIDDYISGRAT